MRVVQRYKQVRQRCSCFFGCHLLHRRCLPRQELEFFSYNQIAVLAVEEKNIIKHKGDSKRQCPK